jgi:hypothetical protein
MALCAMPACLPACQYRCSRRACCVPHCCRTPCKHSRYFTAFLTRPAGSHRHLPAAGRRSRGQARLARGAGVQGRSAAAIGVAALGAPAAAAHRHQLPGCLPAVLMSCDRYAAVAGNNLTLLCVAAAWHGQLVLPLMEGKWYATCCASVGDTHTGCPGKRKSPI